MIAGCQQSKCPLAGGKMSEQVEECTEKVWELILSPGDGYLRLSLPELLRKYVPSTLRKQVKEEILRRSAS